MTVGEMPTSRASWRMDFPSCSMRPCITSERRKDRYLLSNFRRRFGSFMTRSNVDNDLLGFIISPPPDPRLKVRLGAKCPVLLAGRKFSALLDKGVGDDDLPPCGEEAQEPIRLRLEGEDLIACAAA